MTSWTVSSVHEISQQEYWSGLPFPSPGSLPDPGFEPTYPACRWILYHWVTRKPPSGTLHSPSFPGGANGSEQRGSAGLRTGGGRDGWKARAPVLCRGGEVVGVEVGAESAQAPLPWCSIFFLWHAQPLRPRPPSPTPAWSFHLLDAAVLCSTVCCPCPSAVPHVCPHWDVCPLPLPTLIICILLFAISVKYSQTIYYIILITLILSMYINIC